MPRSLSKDPTLTHVKEQAPYILCMPDSIGQRSILCIFAGINTCLAKVLREHLESTMLTLFAFKKN